MSLARSLARSNARSLASSIAASEGGGGAAPVYGRAISFVLWTSAQGNKPSEAAGYKPYDNWCHYDSLLLSDGSATACAVTLGTNGGINDSRAVDDGSPDYDIFYKGMRFANTTDSTLFSAADIPFAKYDVFLLVSNRFDSGVGSDPAQKFSMSLGDYQYYVHYTNQNRYVDGYIEGEYHSQLPAWVDLDCNTYRMHGQMASSLSLDFNKPSTGAPAYFGVSGVQIVERLDDHDGNAVIDGQLVTISDGDGIDSYGDSYSAGDDTNTTAWINMVQKRYFDAKRTWLKPIVYGGVGSSTWDAIATAVSGASTLDGILIVWDGESNGWVSLAEQMNDTATMVTAKGDDRWIIVLSISTPSVQRASDHDAWKASLISTYGSAHVFDPRAIIKATDPGDTSVDGLPASAFVDTHHLTVAVKELVAAGFLDALEAVAAL